MGVLFSSGGSSVDVSTALDQVGSLVTKCITWIEGNIVLMTCFVAAMIPVGFMVIRKAKKTAR